MRLYLASRSPRRRELLTQMGVAFDTIIFRSGLRTDPQVDEVAHSGEAVLAYVERVARAKADHGVNLLLERRLPLRPVLAADTILEFAGMIIGKPLAECARLGGIAAAEVISHVGARPEQALKGLI